MDRLLTGLLSFVSVIYCAMMFLGLPLLYHNNYYDIGIFKYNYFYYTTLAYIAVCVVLILIIFLNRLIFHKYDPLGFIHVIKTITLTDKFAAAYLFICLISFVLSRYNTWAFFGKNITNPPLKGYYGWNMGLLSQAMFVLIYFLLSRTLKYNFRKKILFSLFLGSGAAFILAILHRFMIDPLGLYTGIEEPYRIYFLSTLGQATWFSSFLCTVMPVAMALFIYETRSLYRLVYALYISITSMALVTQNSDSAFAALFAVLTVLLLFSINANNHLLKYLQLVILILLSFRIMGIFRMIFKDRAADLSELSVFFSQSGIMLIVTIFMILFYFLMVWLINSYNLHISKYSFIIRYLIILLILIVILLYLIFAILTTGGYIEDTGNSMLKEYLKFDDSWGNGRGFTWKITIEMFRNFSFQEKLFGIGPDCYVEYAYEFNSAAMKEKWGMEVLANAHNEWLNSVFTTGIAGFITYIGTFLSAAYYFVKNRHLDILCIGAAASIFSYITHNMFCYQQVLCTPVIFIIMAFVYADVSVSRGKD